MLPGVVARADELARITDFVASPEPGTRVLVVEGVPGIGKTTLWESGVALAREHGLRVLTARSSGAETALCFAAVVDLFDEVTATDLETLPSPQRRALEVALLRADPGDEPAGAHPVALGVLSAVRALAADAGLLVALDDVQWLDPASLEALAFVLRRPGPDRVRVLLARRTGPVPPLEQAVPADRLARVEVGPQTLGATRQLLARRLGLRLSRHDLRQVHELTQGNPLFALSVGRQLAEERATTDQLPVPRDVEELLGTRLTALPAGVRRVVLALALAGSLPRDDLVRLGAEEALDEALETGLAVVERGRVRPHHPLLAAAARDLSSDMEIRALHLELADVVTEEQRRAVHLARGSVEPDEDTACLVSTASARASARGAPREAAVLAENALRLTPAGSAQATERLLTLAERLRLVGDKTELTELLTGALESLETPAQRVRAHLLLTSGDIEHIDDVRRHLDMALDAAGDDAALRAPVLARMVDDEAVVRLQNVPQAHEWAVLAAASTPEQDDHRVLVRHALAWTQALQGRPVDDDGPEEAVPTHTWTPARIAGQRLVWRGEVDRARAVLTRLLRTADEQGAPWAYAMQRLHVIELELRTGRWAAAGELLDEWADSPDSRMLHWPMYERCRALAAAGIGRVDEARSWAEETVGRADATGVRWDRFEAQRALGSTALLCHDPAAAVVVVLPVWQHCQEHGIADPGVFPVAPDLVEALAESGDTDRAREVTDRLRTLAVEQDHPWGLATADRCSATLRLAGGGDDPAADDLAAAATRLDELGLPYDAARARLALGRAQRRLRRWGAARDTLGRAAAAFDAIGSVGWAADARAELERVGARRPTAAGELTATERRVAELAAEGLANKEIAGALVVTVNTVEFHLRNTYAKLGIRSRAQLAGRLAGSTRPGRAGGTP